MFLLVTESQKNRPQLLLATQIRDIVPSEDDGRSHTDSHSIVSYWTGKETTGRPDQRLAENLEDRLGLNETDIKVPELYRMNVSETILDIAKQMADVGMCSKEAVADLEKNWHKYESPRQTYHQNPPPARAEYRQDRPQHRTRTVHVPSRSRQPGVVPG